MLSPVMSILSGPFSTLLAALLLSGADKLLRPDAAARALATAGLIPGPSSRQLRTGRAIARVLGVVEVAAGVGAAYSLLVLEATDARLVSAVVGVALVYLGFAWFLRRIEAVSPGASCGCFGSGSASGALHIIANLAAAALAVATAVTIVVAPSDQSLRQLLGSDLTVVPLVAAAFTGGLMLLLTPSLVADVRRARTGSTSSVPLFTVSRSISP